MIPSSLARWSLLETTASAVLATLIQLAAGVEAQAANSDPPPEVRVISVRRVFHNGEHNAFTDLCRFRGLLWLTFRSCPDGHMVHPTASIIVLRSVDGVKWEEAHRFRVGQRDTRDPHFLVFQDKLFVYTGTWYSGPTTPAPADYDLNQHLGYAAWTEDGTTWHSPVMLEGTFGHYIWRAATFGGKAYLCGRRKIGFEISARGEGNEVESLMLVSEDGLSWRKLAIFQETAGDETAFLFEPDGSVLGIGRRSGNAQLLHSKPPYTQWQRQELDRSIGGPLLAQWGGRYLVGGRKTTAAGPITSLCWLVDGQLREFAELPSGGDNSYPGFVELTPNRALVSYYSSHEQDASAQAITAIYLAELAINPGASDAPLEIGSRRELMVDHFLVDQLSGAQLLLCTPRDEGVALRFDQPWEGPFSGYVTIVRHGERLRAYYRGKPAADRDGSTNEVTCCAESADGLRWTRPELDLFEIQGTRRNNVVLANASPATHNFCPFLDERPGVPLGERYKALGGTMESGLTAWKSADGLRWQRLGAEPVMTRTMVPFKYMFDSQNVSFWSTAEGKYLCYFRVFENDIRRIARSESDNFQDWSPPVLMGYRHPSLTPPIEHLYTSQTFPYFRAPHLYVAIAARFMPGRRVLTDEQAAAIQVDPGYFKDTSDAIFMTTRPAEGGAQRAFYDRTFLEGFIRGGIGPQNWVSRTGYPALNVVQTGPAEMSVYVNQDYAQPTAHLRRYSMRLDGFASLHAGYPGGEMVTKPLVFLGRHLYLNFATSAAGGVRVELQSANGQALPGFSLAESQEQIGNELDRRVSWKTGADLGALAGQPVRLRFALTDADIYALQFRP